MLMDKAGDKCRLADVYPADLGASVMESKIDPIETLLLAARYIEEEEKEKAKEFERSSPEQQYQQHQLPMTIVQSTPVLQHVVQQASTQAIPIQHVTLQHHALSLPPTNGHHLGNNITLTTQQVSAIRKKDIVSITTTTPASVQTNLLPVMNSFDLINPPVIDQGSGEVKRKQPPMAFRTGTREVHNKLEKNRRAHLKECFDVLYAVLPNAKDTKKTSNLHILDSAIKHITTLEAEFKSFEEKREHLEKKNIMLKQRFNNLRKEIMDTHNIDVFLLMPEIKTDDSLAAAARRSAARSDTLAVKTKLEQLTTTTITLKSSPPPLQEKLDIICNGHGHGQQLVTTIPTTTVNATPITVVGNVLKLPKSIKGALPVVATTTNGIKENTNTGVATASAAATTVSVLPATAFGYHQIQQNGGLVLQKVIMPKGITSDHLTAQIVSTGAGGQLTHFVDGNGKVMPTIVNAQYVVKPLVVVSTPSRPS